MDFKVEQRSQAENPPERRARRDFKQALRESGDTNRQKDKGGIGQTRPEGSMLISTKGRYALRTLIDMAEHRPDSYLPLKDIADRQEISEKYLESIVKILVAGGIIVGVRGKGGGYRLSRDPDQIRVGDVLRLTEGSMVPVSCLEQSEKLCPRMSQCRTLPFWSGLQDAIDRYIDGFTIADLVQSYEPGSDYVI